MTLDDALSKSAREHAGHDSPTHLIAARALEFWGLEWHCAEFLCRGRTGSARSIARAAIREHRAQVQAKRK